MAGASAKRAVKQKKSAAKKYAPVIVAANLAHGLGVYFLREGKTWSKSASIAMGATACVYAVCYSLLVNAGDGTHFSEYAFDLLALTVVAQLGAIYSAKAYFLFALVPVFATYKAAAWYFGGAGGAKKKTPKKAAAEKDEAAASPRRSARVRTPRKL